MAVDESSADVTAPACASRVSARWPMALAVLVSVAMQLRFRIVMRCLRPCSFQG